MGAMQKDKRVHLVLRDVERRVGMIGNWRGFWVSTRKKSIGMQPLGHQHEESRRRRTETNGEADVAEARRGRKLNPGSAWPNE